MSPVLALYTFGMFIRPSDDPANDDFHAINDPIMALADTAHGMIARSGYASDPGPSPWGAEVYPAFYQERGDGWSPATLSLWTDIEALFAFTYSGQHAKAMARGREWFQHPDWPPLVMWWHHGDTPPQWAEGVRRHQMLHDNGPTAEAFTFKRAFDPVGQTTKMDKARVQRLMADTT